LNKEEIISQGWLEGYITGDLSDEERKQVEHHLTDAVVYKEYLAVQNKLESVVIQGEIKPDAQVKPQVLSSLHSAKKGSFNYMMAASISVALLASVAAFYFWQKSEAVDGQLADLQSQNTELTDNVQRVTNKMDNIRQDLSVLLNSAFARVVLNSTDESIVRKAVIYFNPSEQQVYLNSSTLSELTEGQQYQLWALIDGQPVDAGVFDVRKDEFQLMNSFEHVDAFAVTIEPKGGSTEPTLETMQVYGEVG